MKAAVIGSGTWGLALSQVLCDNGHDVTVYSLFEELATELNTAHTASSVFGDHLFPESLYATADLKEAVKGKELLVLSVPTSALDNVLSNIAPYLEEETILVNTAKGFDREALLLPYAAIMRAFPHRKTPPVSLVGPSHAEEVVVRKLTSVCSASSDGTVAEKVQAWFSNNYLRVYTCLDPIGAEVGSAVKNVIAIAAGMSDGLGIGGDNTKAALVTRGICEIVRYGVYKGAKKETFFGLTGVGDLIVTCFSVHSRNYTAGLQIGRENSAENFLKNNKMTVEGIFSCKVIAEEAKALGIEMPLVQAVYEVLFEGKAPLETVNSVMLRPLKAE